jgi:hypothetical protein
MTIWILALLLFAVLALAGYNQGAIRVGFSLLGLVLSALLAAPMSRLVAPMVKGLLGAFSVTNPVLIWALAPLVTFLILLIVFKVCGLMAHKQVEVYYKYKAGELRLALWERLNKRLGACLGLLNALVYLVLIALLAYQISYATAQMGLDETGGMTLRLANHLGRDVVNSGLIKAVRAIDPAPQSYYEASDILGIIYHNPLADGRLARYPAFLALSERAEFQDLGNDKDFLEMLQRQAPIKEIINNPKSQGILKNSTLLNEIWTLSKPNLSDIRNYLVTGISTNYPDPILGRWHFDANASVLALKKAKPNLSQLDLRRLRQLLTLAFGKSGFVAMPDHQAILKDAIVIKPGAPITPNLLTNLQRLQGQWQGADGKYTVTLDGREVIGTIENGKLKVTGDWTPIVFSRED